MLLRTTYRDWQEAVRTIVTQLLSLFDVENTWSGKQTFSARPVTVGVDSSSDVIVDLATKGLVLKDSAGVYWRVTVTTLGALTITNIGSTKP